MRSHVTSARSTTLSLRFSLVSTTTARSASSSWPSEHSLASPSIALNGAVRPLSQREVWTTSKQLSLPTASSLKSKNFKEHMARWKCELCTVCSNAEAFCRQCSCFIGNECVQVHSKLRCFFGHKIASLEDLKHGRAKPIAVKEPPTSKCEVHKEPFIIYCYHCSCLICQHCTLKNHLGHNYEFTKNAAPDTKAKLLKDMQPLRDLKNANVRAGDKICAAKLKIEAQKQASISNLHTSFKELHRILE